MSGRYTGVCIAGRAGVGKSTLAARVAELLGLQRGAFADALKAEVFALYGFTKSDVGGRELLIQHGEDRRAEDPRYWIRRLGDARGGLAGLVIDDARKLLEVEAARADGLMLVHLSAPLTVRAQRLGVPTNHYSVMECGYEARLAGFDFDLYADTSRETPEGAARLVAQLFRTEADGPPAHA